MAASAKRLTPQQVRAFNQQLSNAASNNVRPPIHPSTSNVATEQGIVIVVTVTAGLNKPCADARVMCDQNGADKRHVTSREEMQRMFLNAGLIQADTLPVPGTGVVDVDRAAFRAYFRQRFSQPCPEAEQATSLTSLGLLKDQQLTLAGVLLFGLQPAGCRCAWSKPWRFMATRLATPNTKTAKTSTAP